MPRLTNLTCRFITPEALLASIVKRLRVSPRDLVRHQAVCRGDDARDTTDILLAHTVEVTLREEAKVLPSWPGTATSSERLTPAT